MDQHAGASEAPPIYSFKLCPEVNNGFGAWYHGTAIRRWQSTEARAIKVASRLARLYRTRGILYATPVDAAGCVRWAPRREVDFGERSVDGGERHEPQEGGGT